MPEPSPPPLFAFDPVQRVLVLFVLQQPNGQVPGIDLETIRANGWRGDPSDFSCLPRVGAAAAATPPIQVAPDMAAARAMAASLNGMKREPRRR